MAETKIETETMRPFNNGTQFADWLARNCERCAKGADPNNPPPILECDIDQALLEGYFGDGRIPLAIAERMGAVANKAAYSWVCGEFQAKEATS